MKLRLQKAISYRGHGITATRENPVVEVEDEATAQKLLGSGYFQTVSEPEEDHAPEPGAGTEPQWGHLYTAELSTWEEDQLRALAQQMNVEGADTLDRAELIEAISAVEVSAGPEPEKPDCEALAAMTKAELTAYAKEHDIDISKCKTKSDILTAISMAYGGSPTMIELQREPGNLGGD